MFTAQRVNALCVRPAAEGFRRFGITRDRKTDSDFVAFSSTGANQSYNVVNTNSVEAASRLEDETHCVDVHPPAFIHEIALLFVSQNAGDLFG